jgi:CRP/FNR family transcriptional regulator, dissimilatory nitrate respiration regulator
MINTSSACSQTALINTLTSCPLLAGLPAQDLNLIADFSVGKSLRKEEYLFRESDISHGFYIVQSGSINVHRVHASGKEQVIHIYRAGESFAEGGLTTFNGYPGDARALEPSRVLLVQKAGFLALLRRQPELAFRVMNAMNVQLRTAISQLENLTLNDVETRLAEWLMQRCPDPASAQPTKIELKMTKRNLAAELGTVSETLSRTLAKFRDQHLLYVNGRIVTLLNPSRLSAARNSFELATAVR